jgi:hypothetical protein
MHSYHKRRLLWCEVSKSECMHEAFGLPHGSGEKWLIRSLLQLLVFHL